MFSSNNRLILVGILTISGIIGTIYHWKSISNGILCFAYPEMISILNLEAAIKLLTKNIEELENVFNSTSFKYDKLPFGYTSSLGSVLSDVDFLFEQLDSLRGGNEMKLRRKVLVQQNKALAARIDKLVSDSKGYQPY